MHSGGPAARKVSEEYAGSTVHRRSLILCDLYIDFHIRLATSEIGTPSFASSEYVHGLGVEFGNTDTSIYEEFAQTFVDGAHETMRGRTLKKTPVLYAFIPGQDLDMYKKVGRTRLFSVMRFMMCKYIMIM